MSPACDNCYAREFAERLGRAKWGKDQPRLQLSEDYWHEPLRWQKKAAKLGVRRRVFCSSMADVMEDHPDVAKNRERLWPIIEQTPNLDWMLLTKRPQNFNKFTPFRGRWPANVWPGTTVETPAYFWRIDRLLEVDAATRWLSCEPLLAPLNLRDHLMRGADPGECAACGHGHGFTRCPNYGGVSSRCWQCGCQEFRRKDFAVAWVIVGGESGENARPMRYEWATDLLKQCRDAGVAYHFKQKGAVLARELGCKDEAGKKPDEWPAELRVQEFPTMEAVS